MSEYVSLCGGQEDEEADVAEAEAAEVGRVDLAEQVEAEHTEKNGTMFVQYVNNRNVKTDIIFVHELEKHISVFTCIFPWQTGPGAACPRWAAGSEVSDV